MPRRTLPRIESVEATKEPLTVRVHWSRGGSDVIDLAAFVDTFKVFAPLRDAPGLFQAVGVGEHGTDIVWNDAIDISNDTLWRLARCAGAAQTRRYLANVDFAEAKTWVTDDMGDLGH